MDKSISIEMINKFQQTCDTDEKLKISRNAATHNEVTDLAMNWNEFRKIDHSFSDTITGETVSYTHLTLPTICSV